MKNSTKVRVEPIDETEGDTVKLVFPGDEGDLAAEDYIQENKLQNIDYDISWDDFEKGYILTYKA